MLKALCLFLTLTTGIEILFRVLMADLPIIYYRCAPDGRLLAVHSISTSVPSGSCATPTQVLAYKSSGY